ncbi:copper chaperone PCu(A)C [Kocuria turfanensis]|uniref:copper chaperone PCu(A)C n=1 Tax=Kocuria turfanensis TaxID=388357 RepID=UPI0040374B6C
MLFQHSTRTPRRTAVLALGALTLTGCGAAADTAPAAGPASPAPVSSAPASSVAAPLRVEQAWVKARTTPGMTGAFATLVNDTDVPVTLVGVTTDGASGSTELHETALDPETGSTVMRRMAEPVTIAPGASYVLEPGGNHIMLLDLQCGLYAGEALDLTLQFDGGAGQTVAAPIRDYAGAQEEYVPGHDHDEHGEPGHDEPGHTASAAASALPSCHE